MDSSVFTFPYQYKQSDPGPIPNPLVPVFVKASWGWQRLWFLVDSGADTTMLTFPLAQRMGLHFDTKKKTSLFGVGDHKVDAFLGEMIVRLGTWEMKIRAHFLDGDDSALLLGRLDVFDRLTVCFDHIKRQVAFYKRSEE